MQFDIKGVFDNNPYPSAINGSLWTIPYEFTLYIFLSFFIFISNNIFKKILILTSFLVMYFGSLFYLDELSKIAVFDIGFLHLFNLGAFFVGGAVLASFKFETILNNRKIKYLVLLFLFFTILLTIKLEVYNSFKHLFLTLFVLLFGLMSFYPINNLHKIGDYSYGIYIYSFPIQQTLMYYFKFSTGKLICYSVLISLLFGVLSWFFVEKKLLAFKNRFN
jgi:peptidoglycan/LPS O-acetylase OafA/YrhL